VQPEISGASDDHPDPSCQSAGVIVGGALLLNETLGAYRTKRSPASDRAWSSIPLTSSSVS